MNIKMESDNTELNMTVIEKELLWLSDIIKGRIESFTGKDKVVYKESVMPEIAGLDCSYTEFINRCSLTAEERKVLLLALAVEVNPEIFDQFLIQKAGERCYTEFGGISNNGVAGFIPTVKTALFVLAGSDIREQMKYSLIFRKDAPLYAKRILRVDQQHQAGIENCRTLVLTPDACSSIMTSQSVPHEYTPEFPANELTTTMEWDDLVLTDNTRNGLKELMAWLEHGEKLSGEYNMGKIFSPGYRILFYGPSGTGKTLCATLIGKKAGKPVYRIDLSQLVSKYIGETEKNLEKIFNMAKNRDWILFFDEADAIFTKRTGISNSNDRYANQETAYLLQRIETCENLVIMASNFNQNIDDAFTRRFQSKVYFSLPPKEERIKLWRLALSHKMPLSGGISIDKLADKIDIAGGSIVNVVRYCTLMAISDSQNHITMNNLITGLRNEYAKSGRTLDPCMAEELKQ